MQRSHAPKTFATTHWSLVLSARNLESPESKQAIATLCEAYWYPLYAYLRRHGHDSGEAADLTQGFFARMLEKKTFERIAPNAGKFRSFLITALKHFVANERDRARAKKRGGGQEVFSLDFHSAESQYALEPVDEHSPDKMFDRIWAHTVLNHTMERLEAESKAKEKQKLFDQLKVYLSAEASTVPCREIAAKMDMTEGAIRVAVHRLRKRCRELLRAEIAQAVASDDQIDDEIRGLFAALGQ